ncbi:Ankyrin repeat domain-containing protein 27 [Mizuhopecten yessoensis]|uniref:Ankyrin repeat domain-containing protein 27 n=2 Tax=Mizuhopecten yessoensis TaxID=6573 RepID=A0A210PQK4_MIZYE|nr:Ankyrin repeat domain-containing protein 27 [Mizuhopecten yessoensis]
MTDTDELDINKFFSSLQTSYLDVYEAAQERCFTVCIPQQSSLGNIDISKRFVETHILRPSPYFQSEFLTLKSSERIVHLEENGKELRTGEGFSCPCIVKILSEELGYNKDYKPFKILVIEKPLDTFTQVTSSQARDRKISERILDKDNALSVSECREILSEEYGQTMKNLDDSVRLFEANYMVLTEYMDDACQRLQDISTAAVEKCLKCGQRQRKGRTHLTREELDTLMESYVVGSVYTKVFRAICEKLRADDKCLLQKCKHLEGVTPDKLKVIQDFSCPLPGAVVELANVDGLKTPLEKLHCLKTTIDCITETIMSHVIDTHNTSISLKSSQDIPRLTSDDLIPILVTVIAQSRCTHLASNMYYIENFHWSTEINDRDNLSYCMVTFKAAVQYMMNTDFSHFQDHKSKVKREISIDELMRATKDATLHGDDSGSVNGRSHNGAKPLKRLDQQLQKISKLVQDTPDVWNKPKSSTIEQKSVFGDRYLLQQPITGPEVSHPQTQDKKPPPQFGGFLGSFEDDIFEQSFGKQT